MKLEEIPDEDVLVWEINWPTFRLFNALHTQWRIGMSGATGLDYNVIPMVAKSLGINNKELNAMFPDLQVMENEALITLRENEKDDNAS